MWASAPTNEEENDCGFSEKLPSLLCPSLDIMHARDAAQSCADVFKLCEVVDAEAQADDGGAAADGAGAHFARAQTQRRENCCNIQHQSVAVVGLDLQRRGEHHVRGLRPSDLDPAALLRGIERGPGVRAVLPVDGHAVALGDKADDLVAGNRRAAAAEFDHARADVLDNNAGGIDGGRILPRKRLGGKRPGRSGQIVADAADGFRRGESAVADGGVHVVEAFEADLLEHERQNVVVLDEVGVDADVAQLCVEARLAADDVLVALLALEPLLDLDAGLVRLADVQPVAARALGRFGRQDLDDIAVVQRRVVAGDAVIEMTLPLGVKTKTSSSNMSTLSEWI